MNAPEKICIVEWPGGELGTRWHDTKPTVPEPDWVRGYTRDDIHAAVVAERDELRNILILCGEPECRDVKGYPEKLRALINGLILLRRENERLRAMVEWQPIETAPKDGKPFVCWVSAVLRGEDDDGNYHETNNSQADIGWWVDAATGGYFDAGCLPMADLWEITHWKPIKPPAAQG